MKKEYKIFGQVRNIHDIYKVIISKTNKLWSQTTKQQRNNSSNTNKR